MAYRIEYSPTAQEEFRGLPRADAERILCKVARLEAGLSGDIKRLQGADVAYRNGVQLRVPKGRHRDGRGEAGRGLPRVVL